MSSLLGRRKKRGKWSRVLGHVPQKQTRREVYIKSSDASQGSSQGDAEGEGASRKENRILPPPTPPGELEGLSQPAARLLRLSCPVPSAIG